MTDGDIDPHDVRLYRRLVGLSAKQLAAIRARVSGHTGRWRNLVFTYRNRRMKQTLLAILANKRAQLGDDGPVALLEDLKKIEVDEDAWQFANKEELDYVQLVLHGLNEMEADEDGLLDDSA